MNLLLDTHTLIWLARNDQRIGTKIKIALSEAEAVWVSVASGWEYGIMRLAKPDDWPDSFEVLVERVPVKRLGLDFELHGYAERLPLIHKDPFDRMLIAQALHHDLVLVTRDTLIKRYAVKTLW